MDGKFSAFIWGIALILLGGLYAGNAFNLWDFSLFFDGWWTLFIIVPCATGLFKRGSRYGSFIGLIVGIILLLVAQDYITFVMVMKLIVPIILILVGIKVIYGAFFDRAKTRYRELNNKDLLNYTAVFGGRDVKYPYEIFTGANITAVCAGVDLDLRSAIINSDVVINCNIVCAGVEIKVPPNVKLKLLGFPLLGGMSDSRNYIPQEGEYTVYVKSYVVCGGVDVK